MVKGIISIDHFQEVECHEVCDELDHDGGERNLDGHLVSFVPLPECLLAHDALDGHLLVVSSYEREDDLQKIAKTIDSHMLTLFQFTRFLCSNESCVIDV